MALYDYDPVTCSPSDNPEFELAFKEGNLVRVLGKEMEDGFLVGEVSKNYNNWPFNPLPTNDAYMRHELP